MYSNCSVDYGLGRFRVLVLISDFICEVVFFFDERGHKAKEVTSL